MEALVFLTLVVPFLLLFYLACMLFVRPTRTVFWYSLLAGLIVGVVNLLVDIIAYYAHWWYYDLIKVTVPAHAAPVQAFVYTIYGQSLAFLHVPLPFYFSPIFIYGSLAYLMIWRCWNGRARWFSYLVLFGMPLFCIIRDITGGLARTSYQMWENIPLSIIVTILFWPLAFYAGFYLFWRKAEKTPFIAVEQQRNQENTRHIATPSHQEGA